MKTINVELKIKKKDGRNDLYHVYINGEKIDYFTPSNNKVRYTDKLNKKTIRIINAMLHTNFDCKYLQNYLLKNYLENFKIKENGGNKDA